MKTIRLILILALISTQAFLLMANTGTSQDSEPQSLLSLPSESTETTGDNSTTDQTITDELKRKKTQEPKSLLSLPSKSTETTGDNSTADQTTTDESGEEIYLLNEFEVSAEQDKGYFSSSTLSGMRSNTLLKDTAASISVVNEQLVEDLNLDPIGSLAEVLAEIVIEPMDTSQTVFPDNRTISVRGIRSRGQLFDFFPRRLPQYSYNTGRTELLGGTNSLVLGQADPGGKVNSSSKRATFSNDNNHLEATAGEYRNEFEAYKNIQISDTLAINIMGTAGKVTSPIKYQMSEYASGTLAVTYRPTLKTQFRAHLEGLNQRKRGAYAKWKPTGSITRGTGILTDITFSPDILDYYPDELIEYAETVSNNTKNNRAFFSKAPGGPYDFSDIQDFMNYYDVDSSDYSQFVSPDPISHTWGFLGILGVTHIFTDNIQGSLELFHETVRNESIGSNRANTIYVSGNKAGGNIFGKELLVGQQWSGTSQVHKQNGLRGNLLFTKDFKKSTHQLMLGVDLDHMEKDYCHSGIYETGTWNRYESIFTLGTYNTTRFLEPTLKSGQFGMPNADEDASIEWRDRATENVITKFAATWVGLSSTFWNGKLNLQGGARGSYYESNINTYNFKNAENGKSPGLDDKNFHVRAFSPSIGGVFWFTDSLGIFGSWSRSIQSETGNVQDPYGNALPPAIGTGSEFGIRWELEDLNISGEILAYQILQDNVVSERSAIPDQYKIDTYPDAFEYKNGIDLDEGLIHVGSVADWRIPGTTLRSHGISAKLNYNPSKTLSLRINYSNNNVKYIDSPGGFYDDTWRSGNFKHRATVTAKYTFKDGPLDGIFIGINQKYVSGYLLDTIFQDIDLDGTQDFLPTEDPDGVLKTPKTYQIWSDHEWQTELYTGWKGQLPWAKGRKEPKYGIQLNVKNLFDNTQLSRSAVYIKGRTFTVKVSADF